MITASRLSRVTCRFLRGHRTTASSQWRAASIAAAKQHKATRTARRQKQTELESDDLSARSRVAGSKPQPRHVRVPEPRTLVLPDSGLTARQLAALADACDGRVLRCARELDDSTETDATVLSPALIELVTEELLLNIRFRPQTYPLLAKETESNAQGMKPRMPVVTVMGHVDHGKTSLLDALRNSDVAKREVGGITQSVAAFQVPIDVSKDAEAGGARFATFIDTPGHAAFKAMRANGTVGTDIVILVVAADDGVMPQTVEAGNLARAANVPIIVAINKCDTPGADPERVRYQLVESLGISTEQLGGDVQCVEVSAKTGANLPELLEAISLQTEMLDLRSDPKAPASGVCLESRVDRSLGSIATVVVRAGTLRPGDFIVFQSPQALRGDLFGRVRGLVDKGSGQLKEAGPGIAAGVIGVREPIPPGAEFAVVENEKTARARSHEMITRNVEAVGTVELANALCAQRDAKEAATARSSTALITEADEQPKAGAMDQADEDTVMRSIVVAIKGDVKGSADAVKQCIECLGTPQYPIRVIEVGVGDVTDGDVKLVSATRSAKRSKDVPVLIAFNVRMRSAEERHARQAGVQVLRHKLIYHLEDEMKQVLDRVQNESKAVEESLGKAAVLRVFDSGRIAGCAVEDGVLSQGDSAKVWRFPDAKTGKSERELVFTGTVDSIKHFSKDVKSVKKGSECGIGLLQWSGFVSGDVIECIASKRQTTNAAR